MKNTVKEFNELIQRYFDVKDELLEHTEEFHDNMFWDAIGYSESAQEDINDVDVEALRIQVESFELIKRALDNINYTYC